MLVRLSYAPVESLLSSEPNLEALCRAYAAQAEDKKQAPASTKAAASPKPAEKKAQPAKPEKAKPASQKAAGDKKK